MQHVAVKALREAGGQRAGMAGCSKEACEYDNKNNNVRHVANVQCGRGWGRGCSTVKDWQRQTKSATAGRPESQLNNSSRQLDWLRTINLMTRSLEAGDQRAQPVLSQKK